VFTTAHNWTSLPDPDGFSPHPHTQYNIILPSMSPSPSFTLLNKLSGCDVTQCRYAALNIVKEIIIFSHIYCFLDYSTTFSNCIYYKALNSNRTVNTKRRK